MGKHRGMTNIPSAQSLPISMVTGDPVVRVAADATVGDEEPPAALVSERDIVRVVVAGKDPALVPALDVASTKLVWCDAESTVEEVAVQMMQHYIRHILVGCDGASAGIVSARDLLGVCSA